MLFNPTVGKHATRNFIKEQRDFGMLEPIYVPTDSNTADVFTKPCNQTVMDRHIKQITGQEPKYCLMARPT